MIGAQVSELIAEVCLAMEFHADSEDVARTFHPHPGAVGGPAAGRHGHRRMNDSILGARDDLGALLHDLGLIPPYRRDNRFEIDGADAARDFCAKHQVSPERADLVWKAIALHTSPGIPTRLAGEIALVHLGAGLDFLGLGLDQVPPQVLEEILEKYPRMKFKS